MGYQSRAWQCGPTDQFATLNLPGAIQLLSKAGAKWLGKGLDVEMGTLHEVMTLLSVTVDREIVNRMLHREDGTIGSELMESLRVIAQNNSEPARSPCPA